ncbi:hypothetical protein CAC42_3889 [Sphaceloma murrayae]|uniref:Anaphase-promoting complex subunit 2 n=1 Tax=Sphaceloma murrayae TaxID=2082308 RepID=A0A2K1QSL9_9PEZI|nr:hypothetical protein CAC42_3889 [Sphaceloma murrayae]
MASAATVMSKVQTTQIPDVYVRAFNSVFPPRTNAQPILQATPHIGTPPSPTQGAKTSDAGRLNNLDAAFDIVTHWLVITDEIREVPLQLDEALDALTDHIAKGRYLKRIRQNLSNRVCDYVESHLTPILIRAWEQRITPATVRDTLSETTRISHQALDHILRPLHTWLSSHDPSDTGTRPEAIMAVRTLHSVARESYWLAIAKQLPARKLNAATALALHQVFQVLTTSGNKLPLRLPDLPGGRMKRIMAQVVQVVLKDFVNGYLMRVDWTGRSSKAGLLREWVYNALCPAVERIFYDYIPEDTVPQDLVPGVVADKDATSRVDFYQAMALNILGQSRLPNLLDYIQRWPESTGAILELKEYSEARRENKESVRAAIVSQMEARLLHAGATTAELLGIYVKLIHVCFTLSPQGVLLERVASPLRALLRERPDTVKVIASSFLAELDENNALLANTPNPDEVCPSITYEVQRTESILAAPKPPLDWSDMTWQPDPIDAGPDHRLTRHNDVVHFTLSLFERDAFIKEIESILGERLLRSEDESLVIETKLVEMLKNRLGDDRLQAADVMLRDMRDSVRIGTHINSVRTKVPKAEEVYDAIPDEGISFSDLVNSMGTVVPGPAILRQRFTEAFKEAAVGKSDGRRTLLFRNPDFVKMSGVEDGAKTAFEAKVLSAFFWPKLRDDAFKVPVGVKRRQEEFEREFRAIKKQRRLEWLSALGRSTVEVELSDRTVRVEGVKTWVAAVVNAFESSTEGTGMDVDGEEQMVRKSVEQLEDELQMDEVLVRNALSFWVGHRVLKEVETDVYEVLERLPTEGEEEQTTSAPRKDDNVSSLKSKTAVLEENKSLYEMFITGMLTNGGAMEPARIAMMLNMAMPNGFGYGNDEMIWLLQGMEADGKVEKRGDAWAIKK